MTVLATDLAAVAETEDFAGVVRVRIPGEPSVELERGFADRSAQRPILGSTRFGVASGTKGLTALTILHLAEAGLLTLDTPAAAIVGHHLPNVPAEVTIDHLLSHRSGIGDYLDEEALDDDAHVLGDRSAHLFVQPSDYVHLLAVPEAREAPGTAFRYNNSGFMVLALIVETLTGDYHAAVEERVLGPAGMHRSGFFRSDDLPPDTAVGYLQNGRSNVFHLPVVGGGDGGVYLCADDTSSLWAALFGGRIVSPASVALLTEVVSDGHPNGAYGRGVWLGDGGDHVWIEGQDAGVSFQSGVRRARGVEYSVFSNTSDGAWPLVRRILEVTDEV